MMSLEKAIQKCTDRRSLMGEDADIYKVMYQYKAIVSLPKEKFEEVYEDISDAIFGSEY